MPLITVPGENDPDVDVHYENVGAGKPVFASAVAPYLWKSDGDSDERAMMPHWPGARTGAVRGRIVISEMMKIHDSVVRPWPTHTHPR